mgnify:CR=1 FL=1
MGKYDSIIRSIFSEHYVAGTTSIRFEREELSARAKALNISTPKNLGDIVYSYKFRKNFPDEISSTAPDGHYWRIRNIGRGQYEFVLEEGVEFIEPDPMLATIKIPDATPSIVKKYSASDEQALLTVVRYNRLIDVFLGVTCYSLQNHLRTTVEGIGQIETDEIYVGVDKRGRQFIIPVQAKGGTDKIGVTQIEQDIELCKQKYPELICRAIACQFITHDEIAMFEFSMDDGRVVKNNERRYKMVEASSINGEDLAYYDTH